MLDILRRLGSLAPLIVFLGATAESAAFIGLLVPGELIVIAGGALAGTGDVPFWVAISAGVGGAIAGDSIGYWLGHRYGRRMLDHQRLARFRPRFDRAADLLERHGWWALVVARFAAMLRAVVPFAAGATGMSFGRFALGNVVGGILWGTVITGLGFAAGSRWEAIEEFLRTGGLLLAGAITLVMALALLARWIARHPARVRRRVRRWLQLPVLGVFLRLLVTGWGQPRPFVRLLPLGVALALLVALAAAAALVDWSFAERDLLGFLVGEQRPRLTRWAEAVADALQGPAPAVGAAAAGVVALALRSPRRGLLVTGAFLLQLSVVRILNGVVDRPYGPIPADLAVDSAFPSPQASAVAALLLGIAWPWGESWVGNVTRTSLGAILAVVSAPLLVLAGAAYPVDAAAGLVIGLASVLAAGLAMDDRLRNSITARPLRPDPEPPDLPRGRMAVGEQRL